MSLEPQTSPAQPRATPSGPGSGFGIRHLMFAIVVLAILLVLGMQFGKLFLVLFLTLLPLLIVGGIVFFLFKNGSSQREAMLSVISIAADRGMPLGPGLAAFADLCTGRTRRRCLALAYLLESGMPFPRALGVVPGLLPQQAAILAIVGHDQGNLPAGLRQARKLQASQQAYRSGILPKFAYLCGLLLAMQVVVGYMAYKIAPKFQAIFADFGIPLPALTDFVVAWSGRLAIFLPFFVLFELAVLIYLPFSYFGIIRWQPPFLSRIFKQRDVATILRSIAIAVESGRPIESALDTLSTIYPRRWLRGRLAHARVRLENGEPWTAALVHQRLLRPADAAVLESAQRAGNLPWALEITADSTIRRVGYRLEALSQWLFPLVILAVGCLVFILAAGYFLPLVQLIQNLAY